MFLSSPTLCTIQNNTKKADQADDDDGQQHSDEGSKASDDEDESEDEDEGGSDDESDGDYDSDCEEDSEEYDSDSEDEEDDEIDEAEVRLLLQEVRSSCLNQRTSKSNPCFRHPCSHPPPSPSPAPFLSRCSRFSACCVVKVTAVMGGLFTPTLPEASAPALQKPHESTPLRRPGLLFRVNNRFDLSQGTAR